jgi:catechol 2,3-dioxygenase-like lactoylglutathione lyase family enzyme/uncharacterized damage-inducible protein DinB
MTSPDAKADAKADLRRYLQVAREALLWKLEGLSEYDVRRPMTRTATNLLGVVKHVASVEAGYFGDTFGRPFDEPLPWFADDAEPNADMWAPADESREQIVGLYQRVWAHSDTTIEMLDLDAIGRVPWWPAERSEVTLHKVLVHMIAETNRHVGHADIVRELIDGAVGLRVGNDNMAPGDEAWWAGYRDRVESAARQASGLTVASQFPRLRQVVLDCTDPRRLADFYRELLGFDYRAGHETPDPEGDDWLVVHDADGRVRIAFQRVDELVAATWPDPAVPQQLHLDLTVDSLDALHRQHQRVVALGARLLLDRADDPEEPLRVYADLAGHPFCIFVLP